MEKAIGIFDSGLGGLTVLRQIMKDLPRENTIYLGDTARVPYGPRSREEVIEFTMDIVDFLMDQEVKALVIACNTITAVTLDILRERLDIPVIGVIEPGARSAVEASHNQQIGVIATAGTISSGSYNKEVEKLSPGAQVIGQACPRFVELVEAGQADSEEAVEAAREYIEVFNQSQVDSLILGCTHFPILEATINKVIRPGISLIDPAIETSRMLGEALEARNILNTSQDQPRRKFYVTKDKASFERVGETILGRKLGDVEEVDLK